MNAAAREIHQSNFFNGQKISEMHFSRPMYGHMLLLCAVLFSALAVIYVTNSHRLAFSQLQAVEQEAHQLQLQWGQLLLEQASLATPARVETMATEQLHMVLPTSKQTVILRAQ